VEDTRRTAITKAAVKNNISRPDLISFLRD
jgi:hypothetical protein